MHAISCNSTLEMKHDKELFATSGLSLYDTYIYSNIMNHIHEVALHLRKGNGGKCVLSTFPKTI